MARNRGVRGGGFGVDTSDDHTDDNKQPDVIVTDEEGRPIGDDYAIVDDPEPQIAGVVIAGDEPVEPTPVVTSTDERYSALEANLARLTRERDEANAGRAAAEERAQSGELAQHQTQAALIASGLETAKQDLVTAKHAYAVARASNDPEAEANAQVAIAAAVQDIREYENAVAEFKRTPPPAREPAARAQPNPTPADQSYDRQVDALLETWTPAAKEFAAKHRSAMFIEGNNAPLQGVIGAHHLALAKGMQQDSKEYFDFIEAQTGLGAGNTTRQQKPSVRTKPAMAAAPVNNGGGGGNNAPSVQLSRKEVEMAQRMGISPATYGKHKLTALNGAKRDDYTGPKYTQDREYIGRRGR